MRSQPKHQCPCCDYFSLDRRGAWHICRVCFWEDDGQDLEHLDGHSGPNHLTLREARENFRRFGACTEGSRRFVLTVKKRGRLRHQPRPEPPSNPALERTPTGDDLGSISHVFRRP